MVKAKHQRLILIALAMTALIGAALLAIYGLRNQANYFYLPEDIAARPPAPDTLVRLGGMVAGGSLKTAADGITITFVVTGRTAARVPVRYAGIVPDLFKEGSGVVAEGRYGRDGVFAAETLLAKHDETYVPRELEGMTSQQAKDMAETSTVGL